MYPGLVTCDLCQSHPDQTQHFPPAVASRQFHASTLPTEVAGGSDGKELACSAGNAGSVPASGKSPGVGNGKPLQYSCLENHRGAWWAIVHGVA